MSLLVIGDSWASAHEADTDNQYAGWPEILGVQPDRRQAVAGSTAAQWAADFDGRLTRAIATPAEAVFVSIGGNDVGNLRGFADASRAIFNIRKVVGSFAGTRGTVVMLYANPFPGNADVESAVGMLNGAIRYACRGLKVMFFDSGKLFLPEHFLQRHDHDIHPTRAGWALVAEALAAMLKQSGVEP